MIWLILGTMLAGDLLWWLHAHRSLPRHWMRVIAGLFAFGMFAGLSIWITARMHVFDWEDALPRWANAAILIWHLLILLPWLIFHAARSLVTLACWLLKIHQKKHPSSPGEPLTRRELLKAAAVFTPPFLTLAGSAGGETQLDDFRIRSLEVPLPNLPPSLDGVTIAHLSDLHIGRYTHGRVLEKMVEETNRLNTDVIALTGDLINDRLDAMPALVELTRALRARHIVAACEGNHDLIANPAQFYRLAEKGGIPLLRNEAASVEIRGCKIQILGQRWDRREPAMLEAMRILLTRRDPSAWSLLLAHHPHVWDVAADVPLTLAGHTHGGQLMLNENTGPGPMMYRYWSGLYRHDNRALVVSNGIGNWFPIRVQAPAELLHLTLRRVSHTGVAHPRIQSNPTDKMV